MSEGKRVLVAGASSGIGLAAATALARAGHTLFATAQVVPSAHRGAGARSGYAATTC